MRIEDVAKLIEGSQVALCALCLMLYAVRSTSVCGPKLLVYEALSYSQVALWLMAYALCFMPYA